MMIDCSNNYDDTYNNNESNYNDNNYRNYNNYNYSDNNINDVNYNYDINNNNNNNYMYIYLAFVIFIVSNITKKILIVRTGDRTPKQKMKFKVSEPRYLDYFHTFAKGPYKDLKVKSKSALVRFLEITRDIITEGGVPGDLFRQLKQIRDVLERWEISGFNRKLQMKPQKWSNDESGTLGDETVNNENVPEKEKSVGNGTENPPSPSKTNCTTDSTPVRATEVLVILKWGGDLTPLGRQQVRHSNIL